MDIEDMDQAFICSSLSRRCQTPGPMDKASGLGSDGCSDE